MYQQHILLVSLLSSVVVVPSAANISAIVSVPGDVAAHGAPSASAVAVDSAVGDAIAETDDLWVSSVLVVSSVVGVPVFSGIPTLLTSLLPVFPLILWFFCCRRSLMFSVLSCIVVGPAALVFLIVVDALRIIAVAASLLLLRSLLIHVTT